MASIQNIGVRLFLRVVVKKKKLHLVSVRAVRHSLEMLTKYSKIPRAVKFEKTEYEGIPIEWTIPDNLVNPGVVIYLHGGGYISGSIKTHRGLVGGLAKRSKTKFLSVEYRLAPENPFPAGLDDVIKIYHWLLQQGYDHNKIVIAGDSAGGGLAIATLTRLKDEKAPMPAAGVCMSPWLDLECTDDLQIALDKKDPMVPIAALRAYGKHYAKDNLRHPYASLLYSDPTGLPPLFIQVSDSEVLYRDTVRYEKMAKAAGVQVEVEVWKNMVHVWQAYGPILPEAMQAIKKLGEYIETKTK